MCKSSLMVVAATAWLLLCGGVCEMVPNSEPVSYRDLIGGYGANFADTGADSLFLLADSVYVHVMKRPGGTSVADTGRWTMGHLDAVRRPLSVCVDLQAFKLRPGFPAGTSLGPFAEEVVDAGNAPAVTHSLVAWKSHSGRTAELRLGNLFGAAWVKEWDK